jgi:DNA invertase Pin-like site-specific DNA recombinase
VHAGVFAEFETNLRRERQLEGIAKAKAAGIYKGRKPSIDRAAVAQLRAEGHGPSAIAATGSAGPVCIAPSKDRHSKAISEWWSAR